MLLPDYLEWKGLTQLEFSLLSNVAVSTISKICQGGGATATQVVRIRVATKGKVRDVDLVPRGTDPLAPREDRS